MTHILLIEDNPIDARLMQWMFEKSNEWPVQVTWIDDGQKALWYLQSLEGGGVAETPNLVLLDLNLPKYDGLQVLEAYRASPAGRALSVFLMSSLAEETIAELAANRNLRAEGYFQKPDSLSGFDRLLNRLREFSTPSFLAARTAAGLGQRIPGHQ